MDKARANAAASRPHKKRRLAGRLAALMLALANCGAFAQARSDETVKLQIIGGLAGVTQYLKIEEPFWQSEIRALSAGRISATIRPLDAGGLRNQEMLQLMRLGVVSFGTALLSVVAGEEPELSAVDLPALNPDVATLRRTVGVFRNHMQTVLRTRYDIELLGIYAYPAQVLFCTRPFKGLDDLAGRKIRTSSVGQSELMAAIGAVPVILPFAEILTALRDGVADCAITGTLSGYEIGLPHVTTSVHTFALGWGVSIFAANTAYWDTLPEDARGIIRRGVSQLETRIWSQAEADTQRGLACNAGAVACSGPPERPMTIVPASPADEARRRQLLAEVVLPRWFERCGQDCVSSWNTYLEPLHAIRGKAP
ncbi:TRAP-type C4-dicarboxylate transport system substrate-binding protein [Hyphomicrobiales bacterium]|nr:TRAP-type C4-dicarboxylate transport system substrate-binding protein [Hyphomicrobiales bacterium]CAH1699616.1 TRAP-type C4-dicarboxylate transport system substrate-binding protein [Hyphomicrobiales bacterium]CAI0343968.1 TRAP-type C4-dicarboxylate transport system substrate-binding protein [Hyphomicrobiales bacterium]